MKKYVTAAAVAAGILTAGAASAQTPPATAPPQEILRARLIDVKQAVLATMEMRTATGRPYSAEAVTEFTQVLSDGNRIERQTVARVYRDGQGRTRREQVTNNVVRSISISDPVAQVGYTLEPEKKIARRTGVSMAMTEQSTLTLRGSAGYATLSGSMTIDGVGVAGGGARGGGGGGRGAAPAAPLTASAELRRNESASEKKDDLGQQTIEGVVARGSRTTTTIPAGSIGNLNDIKVISEQWFSDDLQVLVMTKHSDPRSGETIYRLRNVVRAEPDASLFKVPDDYTIQQGGGRGRGGQ